MVSQLCCFRKPPSSNPARKIRTRILAIISKLQLPDYCPSNTEIGRQENRDPRRATEPVQVLAAAMGVVADLPIAARD
jgi:hypothetical protein